MELDRKNLCSKFLGIASLEKQEAAMKLGLLASLRTERSDATNGAPNKKLLGSPIAILTDHHEHQGGDTALGGNMCYHVGHWADLPTVSSQSPYMASTKCKTGRIMIDAIVDASGFLSPYIMF